MTEDSVMRAKRSCLKVFRKTRRPGGGADAQHRHGDQGGEEHGGAGGGEPLPPVAGGVDGGLGHDGRGLEDDAVQPGPAGAPPRTSGGSLCA